MHQDEVYGPERRRALLRLLRALAARIADVDDDRLLASGPELIRMMGDARSELFHYEVRCTYDTPEVAESRRIVDEARRRAQYLELESDDLDFGTGEDLPWRE